MKSCDAHIELDDFWPYQIVVLADQISRHTLSVVKELADLNLSQWRVLAAVADKPGRSAAEVTAVTPMDKTIVSRAVASLIETGLIEKTPTHLDKRRQSLTMTKSGSKIYAVISKELNKAVYNFNPSHGTTESFVKILQSYSEHMKTIEAS